jgi:hypothetical protein
MFWYLATPYSKYHGGIYEASRAASREAAVLIRAGVPVFCPIAHSHPIAINGGLDPLDHKIWLPACQPMMDAAGGLIVCMLSGWQESVGVEHEICVFEGQDKPIVYMTPGVVPDSVWGPLYGPAA